MARTKEPKISLSVMCTLEEYELFSNMANSRGLPIAAFFRQAAHEYVDRNKKPEA